MRDRGEERSKFLAFVRLDEQTHCLLRFLLDSGVQGEVLVRDANLGVISKKVLFRVISLDEIIKGVRVDREEDQQLGFTQIVKKFKRR